MSASQSLYHSKDATVQRNREPGVPLDDKMRDLNHLIDEMKVDPSKLRLDHPV